jgi:hypothetical protein
LSDSGNWQDLIVTLDERGVERLAKAAAAAAMSLRAPHGPRSPLSPLDLHELITSIEICPATGVGLNQVL